MNDELKNLEEKEMETDELKENSEEITEDISEKNEENDEDKDLKTQKQTGERGWYVIHTYSGYEEQVAENLKQRIESLGMEDKIFQVLVPKEKQI